MGAFHFIYYSKLRINLMVKHFTTILHFTFMCVWLGYGTRFIFMFFVVLVLQSRLIAQMSDTFTNIQIDATHTLADS